MKHIKSIDFIRAFCVLGIVLFHFSSFTYCSIKPFYMHANGYWGQTFNALFFALSGFLLQLKYGKELGKISTFYFKRWKSLMPAYLLAFIFTFLFNVSALGKVFYEDIPRWRLLLSFLGLDGYAEQFFHTYFAIGVWFIGAILIMYLIYPLLRKCFALSKTGSYLIIWLAFIILFCFKGKLSHPLEVNPITCLLCFSTGMFMAAYFEYFKNRYVILVSCILTVVLLCVPLGGNHVVKEMLTGFFLLLVLYNIGEILTKSGLLYGIIKYISTCSYEIVILHYAIILRFFTSWNYADVPKAMAVLLGILVCTILLASVLHKVTKMVCCEVAESRIVRRLFEKR